MDPNEYFSPGSRGHRSSLGLLDENAIQDFSMENLHKVRDKPPIPFKQINSKNILQARQINQNKSLNFDATEQPDQTQESVHFNESDLKQLDYDFTINGDEDDDEDKENHKSYKTKLNDLSDMNFKDYSKNFGYSFAKTDFTSVSPDNFGDMDKSCNFTLSENKTSDKHGSNVSNDFLIDESSNILRNSGDLDNTNTDQSNQSGRINYDKMDEINSNCNKTQNSTLNFSLEATQVNSKPVPDLDITPKAKLPNKQIERESNVFNDFKSSASFNFTTIDDSCLKRDDDTKNYDNTLNFTSNMSSIDRINQLVQQSVERVKRIGQAHLMNSTEDYVNLLNHPNKELRYSTSTVRADPKNTSLNFTQDTLLTQSKAFDNTIEPQVEPQINQDVFKKSENPFDESMRKSNGFKQANPFDNPFDNSLGNFGQVEFSQFQQADDFMEQLNQDEQINRKEFADNELTLNQTVANSSNDSNSSKWWKNPNVNQPNSLEASNLSAREKKIVKVEDFFMGKSELPSFLAEKESDVNIDETLKDKTIVEEKSIKKEPSTPQNFEDITFSNQGSSLSSSNFSFTLNSSDTGDFIQPRNVGSKTPFQVTKALETLGKKETKNLKNLDKINEELDKVQNRLANKQAICEPLMSSSIKMGENMKSFDESSINSSDVKGKVKTESKSKDSKKVSSGSLTSTPSKMTKSMSESSNLNGLSATSLMEKFYKSENQDSFISSIPERNDSTLISSNHHHNKHKQKNVKKQKNAEIQTTNDSMKSNDENRQSISNVSSSSDPSSTMNTQFNVINNLAQAMINNSTNSNNPANNLVPVAFIPFNNFIPCVQKFYDDMQTTQGMINKTSMTNLSTNSLNQAINTKLFQDTSCNSSTSSLTSLNYGKFELPLIEFDKKFIDFGHIAEGCSQYFRIHGKLENPNHINKTLGSYFQIELVDSSDWSIESLENDSDEKTKKLEDDKPNRVSLIKKKLNEFTLKSKFRKTLSIFPDKNFDSHSTNHKVQFDLFSNFFEFFIQLNTGDLQFFKDLISQLDSSLIDQLEPLSIKTSLYIYFYFNNSDNFANPNLKKYLLNRIDVKFVLGYSRLRTLANIDHIEFEIPDEVLDVSKNESFADDGDKTLTSVNEMSINKTSHIIEQSLPLSNAGNIDVVVDCFLTQNGQQVTSVKFRDYELKLDDSMLFLESKSAQKQFVRLMASRVSNLTNQINWETKLDNVILTVEIKPNGLKYEFPIRLKTVKKIVQVQKTSKNVKLSSSRSILFFGKSLTSSLKIETDAQNTGLKDELTIANSNNFKIKVQLSLSCTNSSQSYFKFTNEMVQENTKLNDSMTILILNLEPNENFRLKLRFCSPQNDVDVQSIVTGILKMTIHGSISKFTVNLVAFMAEGFLEIDNGLKELQVSDALNQQLTHRNVKNFKYPIEFIQTSTTNSKSIYRKIIKLRNKSHNSKLIVYPCVFNNKLNKEVPFGVNKMLKSNEIFYELGVDSKHNANRLRVLVNKENQLNSSNDLKWIEIKPDEVFGLNLEIIAQKSDSTRQEFCNLEDFNLCLFWVEYDTNAYCTQMVQNANSTSKQTSHFIDLFLTRILMNNNFMTTQHNLPIASFNINDSSAKLHRLSSISTASLQDQSSISNNSFSNKSKYTRDDFLRLMRQSVKCSALCLVTQSFNFDETKDDLLQISLNKDEKTSDLAESWSVNPSSITIENLKQNETTKIFLKNNLARKQIEFDVRYRSNYLSVIPSNGILEPNGSLELIVKPRSDVFSQLPWSGVISIWCNKIQKDIRVAFYSQENQRNFKNMTNSTMNSLMPSSMSSSSTPLSNTLETGTIMSDISQYTIDSLSLTPLISASFINPPSNSFSVNKTKSFSLNSTNQDDSMTKIVREGNDAHVRFPPVCVTQRKSVELTLTNPTSSYVNWKAYSTCPAIVRLNEELMKSNYTVFIITPNSGAIPPNQNQKIKIEFCPRDVYGQFHQYWEIDTRTDLHNLLQNSTPDVPMSFTCKLILTGKSIPMEKNIEQKLVQQDDEISSRLANRILKSKTNTFNDSKKESEKSYNMKSNSSTSLITQSLLSSTSNLSLNGSKNRVVIKDEIIVVPDTPLNQVTKSFVTIHNRESFECKINVFTLMEPFYCKHAELSVSPKHYVKIPIEFKPTSVGDYTDKILIRIDKYDVPLSCVIKAKCVQA